MGNVGTFLKKNGPTILTGVSVLCGIIAPIWAAVKTPSAVDAMYEMEEQKGRPLTPGEKVQASWKSYIGPAAVAFVGVGCGIASNGINQSTIKQFGDTCNSIISNAAAFEQATQEKISAQKYEEIKQLADQKQNVVESKSGTDVLINETGYGSALFIDKMSGQIFRSDINKIRSVENDINERIYNHERVFLSQYYTWMGLKSIDPDMAWIRGWDTDVDNGGNIRNVKIIVSHTEQLPDGTPVGIVEFGCDSKPKFFH